MDGPRTSDTITEQYQVVLSGTGAGSVSFGPNRMRQVWKAPMTIAVSTSTANKVPTAVVSLNGIIQGESFTGSQDSSDFPAMVVHVGQKITVAWAGGDAGAVATASLTCVQETW